MAIQSFDDYIASYKQSVAFAKTSTLSTTSGQWSTLIARDGLPSAGLYTPNDVTNGLVPVAGDVGFPVIEPFPANSKGYISRIESFNSVSGQLALYDLLFWAGPVTIPNAATSTVVSLASPPSYADRLPRDAGGVNPDWGVTELWAWPNTTSWSNHAHSLTIDYTDQDGNPSTTDVFSTQNRNVGRVMRLYFAGSDSGAQAITGFTVNGAVSASGQVNVAVMRRLWQGRVPQANNMVTWGPDLTGMPEVFSNSALMLLVQPDSTSSGLPAVTIEIAAR